MNNNISKFRVIDCPNYLCRLHDARRIFQCGFYLHDDNYNYKVARCNKRNESKRHLRPKEKRVYKINNKTSVEQLILL